MKAVIVFLTLSLIVCGRAVAQRDTVLTSRLHKAALIYGLSPTQESAFVALELVEKASIDSLNKRDLTPGQRTAWFTNNVKWHDSLLRGIFSEAQWQKYVAIRKKVTEEATNHARQKKINVTAVPVDGQ